MNRFLLALVPLALLTAVGWADTASREQERIFQMQRNRQLIEALVESGLQLAGENDPIKRANHLNGLADRVVTEIRTAARASENHRVEELGDHLRAILEEGVAASLEHVHEAAPPGSSLAQKLKDVQKRTAGTIQQLQDELETSRDPAVQYRLREVLRSARGGQAAVVERAGKATAGSR